MIIINPGAGPVPNATLEHAYTNMQVLLEDAGIPDAPWRRNVDAAEDDGRFSFWVTIHGEDVSVDMPGIPLADVRYLGEPDQNIWHFPRLYVDGSSWVWMFAVSQLAEREPPSKSGDKP